MKELWRKTTELTREYPVLWLPYAVAELIAILLWRLRGAANKQILNWFMTRHSVLGGSFVDPDPYRLAHTKAAIAYLPLGFGTGLVVICVFVVALIVTARMVEATARNEALNPRLALTHVVLQCRDILLFSFKFGVANLVLLGGLSALVFAVVTRTTHPEFAISRIVIAAEVAVGTGCIGWVLAPSAIRLLSPPTGDVAIGIRNRVAIITLLGSEAGMLLGLFLQKVEMRMVLDQKWEHTALSALNSVVANALDVPVFIALALMATPGMGTGGGGDGVGDELRRAPL